jgi:hypothetical protein
MKFPEKPINPELKRLIQQDKRDINIIIPLLWDSTADREDIDRAVYARLNLKGCEREYNAGFEVANAIWKSAINPRTAAPEQQVEFDHSQPHIALAMGVRDMDRVHEIELHVHRSIKDPHPDWDTHSEWLEEVFRRIEPSIEPERNYASHYFGLALATLRRSDMSRFGEPRPVLFDTGPITFTERAYEAVINEEAIPAVIDFHLSGDHGHVDSLVERENLVSRIYGGPIVSAYPLKAGRLMVRTDTGQGTNVYFENEDSPVEYDHEIPF